MLVLLNYYVSSLQIMIELYSKSLKVRLRKNKRKAMAMFYNELVGQQVVSGSETFERRGMHLCSIQTISATLAHKKKIRSKMGMG